MGVPSVRKEEVYLMFRRIMAAILGILLASLIWTPASSADAKYGLTPTEREAFAVRATDLGMTEKAIAEVLKKIERGELPDADSGAEPISTVTNRSGYTITVTSRFRDGSMSSVVSPDLEAMTKAVENGTYLQPRATGVSGCTYTYTSVAITWTNCRVAGEATLIQMYFRLNATMVRGQSARITQVWDQQAAAIGGTFSQDSFGITSPSTARYRLSVKLVGELATGFTTLTATISSGGSLSARMS